MTSISDLTPSKFYKDYLTENKPLIVKDGAKNWPAVEKWKDFSYLEEQFGSQSLLIVKLDKGYSTLAQYS